MAIGVAVVSQAAVVAYADFRGADPEIFVEGRVSGNGVFLPRQRGVHLGFSVVATIVRVFAQLDLVLWRHESGFLRGRQLVALIANCADACVHPCIGVVQIAVAFRHAVGCRSHLGQSVAVNRHHAGHRLVGRITIGLANQHLAG